ncbi:MAG TPA: hypothetical protein VGZ47_03400 [Gemmataceae bacterium]|nr:hypothetical protein [Gemmataceae bacterium]
MRQIDSSYDFRGRQAQIYRRIGSISAVALICASVLAYAVCAQGPANGLRPDVPAEWLQQIEDDKPLAGAKDNAEERKGFDRFVVFARKQPLEALAQNVNREIDSLKLMSSERPKFRGDLVHLAGRLIRLVKMKADAELQKEGVPELYEGWVREENNVNPVAVILSELPTGLRPAEKLSRFVAVDGFFFKLYRYSDPEGTERRAPLLIGRTFSKNEPAPEEVQQPKATIEPPWKMDCPASWLEHIEDDYPVMSLRDNEDEYNAYNYFVQFAKKQSLDDLSQNARRELTFRRLFEPGRAKYRGEIVHVEGRLKRLNWIDANEGLAKDDITLYEGWIFDEAYFSNPTCVVFSELPIGLKPAEDMNVWVSFDGYFFKRYKYKAADGWRVAPLVIGRSIVVKKQPPAESSPTFRAYSIWLVPLGLILAVLMIGTALLLAKFFRRGDQLVHARVANIKKANPFDEPPPQPPGDLRSEN